MEENGVGRTPVSQELDTRMLYYLAVRVKDVDLIPRLTERNVLFYSNPEPMIDN
jgi:hypothetical protein